MRQAEAQAEKQGNAGKNGQALGAARLKAICALLDEGKAEDIVVLDIAGRSALADYMVIAGGTSARHINALADRLVEALKSLSGGAVKTEGMGGGDWVLIDEGDVIIHLFRPEARAFYRLEKIWAEPSDATEAAETARQN